MSLSNELLEQAHHLVSRETGQAKQASLRRAVSAAYYALFHLLTEDAASSLIPALPMGLRGLVQRTFIHGDMNSVCKGFANTPPDSTLSLLITPIEKDLKEVARAFVELQEARHQADYDTTSLWNRADVLIKVSLADAAFTSWGSVRNSPNATVFKSALLLQKQWNKVA